VGLGSTAIATMQCIAAILPSDKVITCKLLKYKNQAEEFAQLFSGCSNIQFVIVETNEDLVIDSDVVVSAVTEMTSLFCEDNNLYKNGVLVVPIHTRGFQNCDLFFDHVFADDTAHVSGFKYFNQFRKFNELSEVLLGKIPARQSNDERILAYNIGLGLHDIYFAHKIYERLTR
jgi:ornithine cyclodeaminase/alanine dehydrogenase-like protein (mu-crystallin family)